MKKADWQPAAQASGKSQKVHSQSLRPEDTLQPFFLIAGRLFFCEQSIELSAKEKEMEKYK